MGLSGRILSRLWLETTYLEKKLQKSALHFSFPLCKRTSLGQQLLSSEDELFPLGSCPEKTSTRSPDSERTSPHLHTQSTPRSAQHWLWSGSCPGLRTGPFHPRQVQNRCFMLYASCGQGWGV